MRLGDLLCEDAVGAWHRAVDAPVEGTVRVLRADRAGDDAARLLMQEEIRRVHALEHPYLLRVLKHDTDAPRPWMLTEPIDGPTLEAHVAARGPLAADDARSLAEGLLGALELLEARRQVHANALPPRVVRVGGGWRLSTFRDVRARDELKTLKGKRYVFAAHQPPERAADHPAPLRPDAWIAWCVGTVLREALGGGAPRSEGGETRPLPGGFPSTWAPAVEVLTAADPAARPQGVAAVRRALSGAPPAPPAQNGGAAVAPAPVPTRKRRRR